MKLCKKSASLMSLVRRFHFVLSINEPSRIRCQRQCQCQCQCQYFLFYQKVSHSVEPSLMVHQNSMQWNCNACCKQNKQKTDLQQKITSTKCRSKHLYDIGWFSWITNCFYILKSFSFWLVSFALTHRLLLIQLRCILVTKMSGQNMCSIQHEMDICLHCTCTY